MTETFLSLELRKQWFINSRKDPIESVYLLESELGRGAYGTVRQARDKASGQQYAIKIIQKNRVSEFHTFKQEIEILRFLDHPNIVKLIECFETDRLCYLVLEYCEGGELLQRFAKEQGFSELRAAQIMRKLLSAVCYCHSNRICHRDLKPANCLMVDPSDQSDIKIIDFGLASLLSEEQVLNDPCGTPYFIAPEVLTGNCRLECDCWSLGVMLYMMLSGTLPFTGKNQEEVITKVHNASYTFRLKAFTKVSGMAKDLISRLLVKDPAFRLTAQAALDHPWIKVLSPVPEVPLPIEVCQNILQFVHFQKFKRATLMFIASRLNEKDIKLLKEIFVAMDRGGTGSISKKEFEIVIKKSSPNIHQNDLNNVWKVLDTNHNGKIDYIEFIAACISGRKYINAGILKTAFEFYDNVFDN